MRRQGQYADSSIAAQMQSAQRMQHNSAMKHFPGRPDALPPDEEHQYISSKAEGQWQWDRDGPKGSNPLSSHMYKEGQGSDPRSQAEYASRSLFQGQRLDPKLDLEKQANKDPRAQAHEQDMEVGYEEENPMPQTFEGLEKKFLDDILKLTREQHEAEDKENARHREKISEINAQYQEKLMTIRVRQASLRDEFLHRESQIRQHQYQQASLSHYQNNSGPGEPHGYGSATGLGESHRPISSAHYDSYRERAQFLGGDRNHGMESRGPYPGGRAYGSGGSRYF